ncbi:hypothetical protein [Tissierella pigra]|uniref:Uncharacterized protein n=1 Tax=Tissierella pigra TaxID=2607614 RepID=A0A6N7XVQ8_9FIRM|nr:hypothetical protein [Tissierella pigra]MSU00624.1 hypothetical protein [Tissierella pigra]
MLKLEKISKILILLVLIFTISIPVAFANEGVPSNRINDVVILTKDGDYVKVPLDDYIDMYMTRKGALYKSLSRKSGAMITKVIVSGQKYINIDEYIDSYMYTKKVKDAILHAKPTSSEDISKFKKVVNVDEKTGEVELAPIIEVIEEFKVIKIY